MKKWPQHSKTGYDSGVKSPELMPEAPAETELQGALHEVSNALTVVLGWLNEARTKAGDGEAREALDVAYAHARRGYLVARRAIGAKVDTEQSVRNAFSVAADAVKAVEREASRRKVKLALEESSQDAMLEASDDALQILVNLVLNALAFSPEKSTVSLRCRVQANEVCFRVEDQGPGVAAEHRDKLFVRGHSLRPGGAGVGLSHSHELAERNGGALMLLPGDGGARFELRWPMTDAPSQTIQRAPTLQGMQGMRLLVVEDDAAVMGMVQFGLEARGAVVHTATTAEELAKLIDGADGYDAALIDFSPIQDDAVGALRRLKAKKGDVPIILISGSAVAPEEELPLAAWVQKPFELGDLVKAIQLTKVNQ